MPVSINNTTLTFNDGTTQTTAGGPYTGARGQAFTTSGTFTIPTGVTALKVTVVGGGGGGGGCQQDGGNSGGGGGGAGSGVQFFTSLTPGATLSVTVGAGGNAGSGGGGNGGTGGTSQIASGNQSITTLSATGGTGGSGSPSQLVGTNGTPTNSAYRYGGQAPDGRNQSSGCGSAFGYGAVTPQEINNGNTGVVYGGGGSGGRTNGADNRNGGAGAAGLVVVEW